MNTSAQPMISTAVTLNLFGNTVTLPPTVRVPRVEQRSDGRYQIRKMVQGKKFWFTGRTMDTVLFEWLAAFHPELLGDTSLSATAGVARPKTVGELLTRYLAWAKAEAEHGRMARKTYSGYERMIRLHIRRAPVTAMADQAGSPVMMRFEQVALDQLTPAMVDEMVNGIRSVRITKSRPTPVPLSDSQRAQARTALGSAFKWAVRKQKWLRESPLKGADNVFTDAKPVPISEIPTPRAVRRLLDWCERNCDWLTVYLLVAFTLGLRAGEVSALTEDSLQWSPSERNGADLPDTLAITQQVVRLRDDPNSAMQWSIELPKRNSGRSLPLSPKVAAALIEQAEYMAKEEVAHPEWDSAWSGFLFRREDGTPIPSDEVTHLLQKRLERVGLPRWTFHKATRHFAASCWIMANRPVMQIAGWLGHRSTRLVEQRYGHLFEDFNAQGADAVERFIEDAGDFIPSER